MQRDDSYADALIAQAILREDPLPLPSASELEVQARWFAGEFGNNWKTEDGIDITIEDFGRWNREPGPDFVGVRARLGDAKSRIGSVEIDRDARDWEHHGHGTNPAFRDTLLHILLRRPESRFFTRTCDHHEVPQVILSTSLSEPSRREISSPLTTDPERTRAILLAAARHRLHRKAAALESHAAARGEDEALFSALAVTMGYKHNTTPFLLLSQRAGLAASGGMDGEAMLFGLSGFLESPEPPAASPELRGYLRSIWEGWWRRRANFERWILPRQAWSLAGIRPANHPHRRIAALAEIAKNWKPIRRAFDQSRESFCAALSGISHSFWDRHFNLNAAALKSSQALLGTQRVADILINAWFPRAVRRNPKTWTAFLSERGPAPAARMRSIAQRFFGPGANGLLRFAAIQQGLLQIEKDDAMACDPGAFRCALLGIEPDVNDSTTPKTCG